MKKSTKALSLGRILPNRRSVWLIPYEKSDDMVIQFQRPIRKTDFDGGKVIPTTKAIRRKQAFVQQMRITPITAYALWLLLNEHFQKSDNTETTPDEIA